MIGTYKNEIAKAHVLNMGYTESFTTRIIPVEKIDYRGNRGCISKMIRKSLQEREEEKMMNALLPRENLIKRQRLFDNRDNWEILKSVLNHDRWFTTRIVNKIKGKKIAIKHAPQDVSAANCTKKYEYAYGERYGGVVVSKEHIGLVMIPGAVNHAIYEN